MGVMSSLLPKNKLAEYQESTFFTKSEIERVFRRYRSLCRDTNADVDGGRHKIPVEVCAAQPELAVNPFRLRICSVFSSDGSGALDFEDLLNLFSIFSRGKIIFQNNI